MNSKIELPSGVIVNLPLLEEEKRTPQLRSIKERQRPVEGATFRPNGSIISPRLAPDTKRRVSKEKHATRIAGLRKD